ncbi:MAG: tetratricopeptide repeat protein [Deltaproteobacteria bacterium]|nr:tetratricopeptide repeat protein [Deltaproteobacteria bacterium]
MREVVLPAVRIASILVLLAGCATVGAPARTEEEPAAEGPPVVELSGEGEGAAVEPAADGAFPADPTDPTAAVAPEGVIPLPGEDDTAIPEVEGGAPAEAETLPTGAGWDRFREARDQADWAAAQQILGQIVAANPTDARAHLELARVLVRFNRLDAATDSARKAFELDRTQVAAGRLAIALLSRQNRVDEADALAEAAAASDARNIDLQVLKVDVLVARKEYLRAIELARSLLKLDEVNVAVMKGLARAYFLMGKEKTAQYIFKRALELEPGDTEILYYLALIIDHTSQDRTKVLAAFSKVVAVKRDFPEALNNMGMIYYRTRNYEEAALHFAEAVKFAPEFVEAQLNLANAYRGLGQFDRSDQVLVGLSQARPDFAPSYFNRGLLYWENEFGGLSQEERILKAVELLRKYKDVAGRSLAADDPADKYIKEALDYVDSMRKAKEEEVKLKAEAEAKLGRLKPEAEAEVRSMGELRARLVKGMEAWQTAGNVDKVNEFQALITDYDEGLLNVVTELKNAIDAASAEDVEYYLGELRNSAGDFQSRVDEIFAEPPPEPEAPPELAPEPVAEPVAEPVPDTGSPIEYPSVEPDPTGEGAPHDAEPLVPEDAAPIEPEG